MKLEYTGETYLFDDYVGNYFEWNSELFNQEWLNTGYVVNCETFEPVPAESLSGQQVRAMMLFSHQNVEAFNEPDESNEE